MPSPDPHARVSREIEVRCYAELNDFLPPGQRQQTFRYGFHGTPSVKDTIEAIGVPHTEIDVIMVNDISVGFDHRLEGGERVAVYPLFERFDLSSVTRLRPALPALKRFVADVHLGSMARILRLLGFDTIWERDLADEVIIEVARGEQRIILTRDKGILKDGRVIHGYWVRNTDTQKQVEEVVRAFDLAADIEAYTRCMECNGELQRVERSELANSVPLQIFIVYRDFRRCRRCHRVYWKGSHLRRLDTIIEQARGSAA